MMKPSILIITGLSGAGKTVALQTTEDLGFYSVDNLPPRLLGTLADLCAQSSQPIARVALVADVRGGQFLKDLRNSVESLRQRGYEVKVLFLEAPDEVLIRRFKETRRPHPLLGETKDLALAITKERDLLSEVRDLADHRLDTGSFNPHQLRQEVARLLNLGNGQVLTIRILTFGFRYGLPADADLVFDVRFLRNPNYVPDLRPKTGSDPEVQEFIFSDPDAVRFLKLLEEFLEFTLPRYQREGKVYLCIAIGCTGGRHRSVAVGHFLMDFLSKKGYSCHIVHRDADR
ncbi:MAG: RNase adapter RapZ [Armatimonadetes bacterium]|nr:RNase adapter RapZ [Armatimonadota bacterium]MDW8121378.1 RNase adapter RapZ [Armatimonadota bacterium]